MHLLAFPGFGGPQGSGNWVQVGRSGANVGALQRFGVYYTTITIRERHNSRGNFFQASILGDLRLVWGGQTFLASSLVLSLAPTASDTKRDHVL